MIISNHAKRVQLAMQAQNALAKKAKDGRHRQKYHFMAPGGWINDPNGCIYFNGEYHLFYQHNPFAAVWGSMHWGHATSKDLVHWKHLPIALAPSEVYDDHPLGGAFSGSAIQKGEELAVLYTATANQGDISVQTQCLATSTDGGITFGKHPQNPLIQAMPDGVSSDFRDPRVLKHGEDFYMVLGAALGKGAKDGGEGCALLYKSSDLYSWEYKGILARSHGKMGTMWECPDLFRLGDKWVLSFSPMFMGEQKSVYLVGNMDFDKAVFTPLQAGELDWGGEYYAAQSMRDASGRTVLMAWQNAWDWMPWWKDHGPTENEGWRGCMALPRTVSLDDKNRIISQPVHELEGLRGEVAQQENVLVGQSLVLLQSENSICFEMQLDIDLKQTTAKKINLELRAAQGKCVKVVVDLENKLLLFDRTNADDGHSHGVQKCGLLLEEEILRVRVFSDTSSIEIFTDGGRTCMSNTVYPTHAQQKNYIFCEGGSALLKQVKTWSMET